MQNYSACKELVFPFTLTEWINCLLIIKVHFMASDIKLFCFCFLIFYETHCDFRTTSLRRYSWCQIVCFIQSKKNFFGMTKKEEKSLTWTYHVFILLQRVIYIWPRITQLRDPEWECSTLQESWQWQWEWLQEKVSNSDKNQFIKWLISIAPDKVPFFFKQKVSVIFLFLQENICYGTHQKCLTEVFLISNHNICFHGEMREI